MEAILATLYLVAFTIWHIRSFFEKRKATRADRPHIRRTFTGLGNIEGRVFDAFRGSLNPLLGGTVLMSLVMLIAAIYTAAVGVQKRELPSTLKAIPTGSAIYDVSLSFLAAAFSAFPVLLLYALMKQPDKAAEANQRKWLRRFGLLAVWALSITEAFLAPRGDIDVNRQDLEISKTMQNIKVVCDDRGGSDYWDGLKVTQYLVCVVPAIWIALTAFITTGFGCETVVRNRVVRRFRAVWRLFVAWFNLLIMWVILLYFWRLRNEIIDRADGLDNNDEWNFGQILAVSTWAPAILEFCYILVFGLENSLQGKMPDHYYISHVTPAGDIVGGPPTYVDAKTPLRDGETLYDPAAEQPHISQKEAKHAQVAASTPPPQTQTQDTPWRQLQNTGW